MVALCRALLMKQFVGVTLTVLLFTSVSTTGGQSKLATPEESSKMLGRVLSAVEDVGAGEYRTINQKYIREALRKLSGINDDIDKRQYSLRLRWLAHHWYGRALLDSGDPKKALPFLETAEKEASSSTISCATFDSCINEKEISKNSELLRQVREKLAATQN